MTINVCVSSVRTSGKCSYRTCIATAEDTVEDITVVHSYSSVCQHIGLTTATIYATANRYLLCTFGNSYIFAGARSCLFSTDVNLRATCHFSHLTTTEYIAVDMCTSNDTIIVGYCYVTSLLTFTIVYGITACIYNNTTSITSHDRNRG